MIGGSGFIGRHVVQHLAAEEIFARVPTRRRERAKQLILLPTADVINADVHDPEVLRRLIAPVDAVINLVGVLHDFPSGSFERNHVELPRKIVDACRETGVKRVIHVSALKAAFDAPSAYLRSKAEGENQIHAGQATGIATTIFRPSVVFGQDDRFLNLFASLTRLFPIIPLGSASARFQPVFVEDLASVIVRSLLDVNAFGRTYEVCGPRAYTLRQLVELVGHTIGVNRSIIELGPSLSMLQAAVLEHLPGKLMTRDNVYSMRVNNVCYCDFASQFGFAPTPVEAIIPTYLRGITPRSRYNWFRFRARR